MIKVRLINAGQWNTMNATMQKWRSADKVALRSIEGVLKGQKGKMDTDLYGQLDEKFQRWASAQKLREFPRLVKMVGLTQKGYFLGILTSDLHAWQSSFSKKQLTFLNYAAKRSGVEQVGIAVLPPTPFSVDPNVDIDQAAILSGIAKGLGFGGARGGGRGGGGGGGGGGRGRGRGSLRGKLGRLGRKGLRLFRSIQRRARKWFGGRGRRR